LLLPSRASPYTVTTCCRPACLRHNSVMLLKFLHHVAGVSCFSWQRPQTLSQPGALSAGLPPEITNKVRHAWLMLIGRVLVYWCADRSTVVCGVVSAGMNGLFAAVIYPDSPNTLALAHLIHVLRLPLPMQPVYLVMIAPLRIVTSGRHQVCSGQHPLHSPCMYPCVDLKVHDRCSLLS
jgi:hypothetical protein